MEVGARKSPEGIKISLMRENKWTPGRFKRFNRRFEIFKIKKNLSHNSTK